MSFPSLESELLHLIRETPETLLDDETFNSVALAIHRYQREKNAPYRAFCGETEVRHWSEIPAVPTSAFRHARLCTEENTVATFRTSGTTGEGFGSHYFPSLALYNASILHGWRRLHLPRLPQLLLIPPPSQAPHSSLSHMMGELAMMGEQTWAFEGAKLDLGKIRETIVTAQASSTPLLVLGTALAFLNLFEQLGTEVLPLPAGSLAMETGGYKGSGRSLAKGTLYAMFRHALHLEPGSILNEYSMTELSSQWYTRGIGQPHEGPPWTRSLVIAPESGLPVGEGGHGTVRLIDLANLGSVIALQTQDLAIRRGDGFELIGRDPTALPRGCSRTADETLQSGEG